MHTGEPQQQIRRQPGTHERHLAGAMILCRHDWDEPLTLNPPAQMVWELIDRHSDAVTLDDIARSIGASVGVEHGTVIADVAELVDRFAELGLIELFVEEAGS